MMHNLDFVCFSINPWESRRARKQQFMLSLSKREDVGKVLYIEPPLNFFRLIFCARSELRSPENRKRWRRALSFKIEPLSDKLFLFTNVYFIPFSFRFQFVYNINLYISFKIVNFKVKRAGFNNIVLWLYHPMDYCLLNWFKNKILSVFDWAEYWAEYFMEYGIRKKSQILRLEEKIIKNTDVVFVVSQEFLGLAGKINENSHIISDGTMPELFDNYNGSIPAEMLNIPHPVLGYSGSVYTRVDFDLLIKLSETLPQCSIVMVGNILFPPEKLMKIRREKNVYFLGGKKYEELPYYMMNFDVCILPYITFSFNKGFPTKLFDYLATGKPIVSTNFPGLEMFRDYVRISHSNEGFIEMIKESLKDDSPQLERARKEKAKQSSWSLRADEIMNIIKDTLNKGI